LQNTYADSEKYFCIADLHALTDCLQTGICKFYNNKDHDTIKFKQTLKKQTLSIAA